MKLDLAEILVPGVIGAGLGALAGGRKGALIVGTGGAGLGLVIAATRGDQPETMGRGQRILQGAAKGLDALGLDPLDHAPGGI